MLGFAALNPNVTTVLYLNALLLFPFYELAQQYMDAGALLMDSRSGTFMCVCCLWSSADANTTALPHRGLIQRNCVCVHVCTCARVLACLPACLRGSLGTPVG